MPRFRLVAPFDPQGDQARCIETIVTGVEQGAPAQVLLGVTGSGKTFTIANVVERLQRPTLVVSHNKTLAAQLFNEFKSFFPDNAVEYFVSYYDYYQPEAYLPQTDTYIEKDSAINEDIDKLRHSATRSLLERRDVLIVASVSCIYGLGAPEYYARLRVPLAVGEEHGLRRLLRQLVDIQYQRNDLDFHRGTFRVRGDVVEIFPAYEGDAALRVEFFGDQVERISRIDPLTAAVAGTLDAVTIWPGSHYVVPADEVERSLVAIEAELAERLSWFRREGKLLEAQRLEQRTRFDLEMIRELGFCSGIENYSRHFTGRDPGAPPPTLLDYFPSDFLLVVDESHATMPQLRAMAHGDRSRKTSLVDHGFRLPSAFDNRPLTFEEFERRVVQSLFVSATPAPYELGRAAGRVAEQIVRPTGLMEPSVEIRPVAGQVEDLLGEIRSRAAAKERVLVTALTKRMAEDLTEHYTERGLRVRYLHSDVETLERLRLLRDLRLGAFDALIGINLLREGLDLPEVSLVAILDADKEGFLRSETSLIQTAGRAARNIGGRVIFYADRITGSIRRAIDETARRRAIQQEYNRREGITPEGIHKGVSDVLASIYERDYPAAPAAAEAVEEYGSLDEVDRVVRELEREMREAAARLDFERAAALRDRVRDLKQLELAVGVGEGGPAGRKGAAAAPAARNRADGGGAVAAGGPEPAVLERLRSAPDVPGVYLMRGAGGAVLYVGKAASLRARLRSYADPARQGPKTVLLVGQIAAVDWFETDTEVEALILEDSLIKQHRPRFNIRQRDDKTYPFLRLSVQEEFPALTVVRRPAQDGARYFGPYITAGAMRATLRLLRRLFPLRLCRSLRPGRPCLNHQMGRCPAPCAGLISPESYRERVRSTALFLQGRGTELATGLRRRMDEAARELRFEEAAQLRDHAAAIDATLERQRVHDPGGDDCDVVGMVRLGERVGVVLLRVRAGRLIGTEAFTLRDPLEGEEPETALAAFLRDAYAGEREVPAEIVVPAAPAGAAALAEWVGRHRGARVRFTAPRAGAKRALLAMAGRNALRLLQEEKAAAGSAGGDALLEELGRIAGAGAGLRSLACLDASNLSGTDAVTSLIWWEGAALRRQRYRRFRIRRSGGPDDFAMIAETVRRLADRVGSGAWAGPDVVLLDGGRGQLAAAEAALETTPWRPRLLLAIAKPNERRETDLVFPAGGGAPLPLSAGSPVLLLLQRVRDEAHRFAVAYHRLLRSKRLLAGPLTGIPGLGPARQARLLATLGGLAGVRAASRERLAELVPDRVAAAVRAVLHPEECGDQAGEAAGP